ncbi:HD domain-containing protein [bacterium]|nr:HD domain-containing protein [bacterium]
MDRLDKQIEFIVEIDKLKGIIRRSYLTGCDRLENSAEHSWHVSILAMILAEHSDLEINLFKVVRMLLVHDIVEIDAGDTYFFDEKGNTDKVEREKNAAKRLFDLLPPDQEKEFREAWEEYEARLTNEARFAYALDRFIPILHSYFTQGKSWKQHRVKLEKVMTLIDPIREGSEALSQYATRLFKKAVEKGYLEE